MLFKHHIYANTSFPLCLVWPNSVHSNVLDLCLRRSMCVSGAFNAFNLCLICVQHVFDVIK